jgi:hypothetical protein
MKKSSITTHFSRAIPSFFSCLESRNMMKNFYGLHEIFKVTMLLVAEASVLFSSLHYTHIQTTRKPNSLLAS